MCAPQDIRPVPITLLKAGRELDDISFGMTQLAHLIAAVDDRVDEHHGPNPETNERASAMLAATKMMLASVSGRIDGLVDRMLRDAGQE
jgi:hypothetical protein